MFGPEPFFFCHAEIGPVQNNSIKSLVNVTTYPEKGTGFDPKNMMYECSAERSDAVLWLDWNPR